MGEREKMRKNRVNDRSRGVTRSKSATNIGMNDEISLACFYGSQVLEGTRALQSQCQCLLQEP